MVKYGRLPPRDPPKKAPTTQYDLVEVAVGSFKAMARPYLFGKVPGTEDEYATHYSTGCPHCGHGIIIEVTQPPDVSVGPAGVGYKTPVLVGICGNCKTGTVEPPKPLEDPFRNPVMEGLVILAELDPLQAAAPLLTTPVTTVADRVASRQKKTKSNPQAALQTEEEQPPDGDALDLGEEQEVQE